MNITKSVSKTISHTSRRRRGRPPPPFSVAIQHAMVNRSFFTLSAIHIAQSWCSPRVQRILKAISFTKRDKYLHATHNRRTSYRGLRFLLLPFLFSGAAPTAHAIPGTNHILINGEGSNDFTRQTKYVKTIIDTVNASHTTPSFLSSDLDNATANNALPIVEPSKSPTTPSTSLRQHPYSFIVDTDSVPYIIDTGANRIIVNDAKLLKQLNTTSDKIKGIGGKCIRIAGIGNIDLPLKSDNDLVDTLFDLPAVYVPSCPYNLMPPQILISEMKQRGFNVQHFEHDDAEYIFHYTPPSRPSSTSQRTLTLPIGPNNLYKRY